jgi:uncharacterized membrane protein YvbJ
MKKCPNCNAIYNDDMLIKCINCGADLVNTYEQQPIFNNIPSQNNQAQYDAYNARFKLCPRCGNHCDPRAVICVKCGIQFPDMTNQGNDINDEPSPIVKVLCFFFPILGLILYLVNLNSKPVSAKSYGKSSLIGFIVGIVAYFFAVISGFLLAFTGFGLSSPPVIDTFPYSEFFYSIIGNLI